MECCCRSYLRDHGLRPCATPLRRIMIVATAVQLRLNHPPRRMQLQFEPSQTNGLGQSRPLSTSKQRNGFLAPPYSAGTATVAGSAARASVRNGRSSMAARNDHESERHATAPKKIQPKCVASVAVS